VAPPQGEAAAGVRVLEALPHSRKLRRGALAGNGFRIVLRDLEVDAGALDERLARIAAEGVPNYFGPQRFGRDGRNLDAAARFAAGERLPGGREPRAFVLSAARALIFNVLLARRVADGSWRRLLAGELVSLDGSGSYFAAGAIDAELEARLARFDVHPSGPLAGRGSGPSGVAGALEAEALAPFATLIAALEGAGLNAQRRALRLRPGGLAVEHSDGELVLEFALPAGAYATVVVRELVTVAEAPGEPDDD
ncbi:MAG TPA: tRNA pseudouridine(13) synthase TruD, partial [Steroidobacteraceae bacterium]|nr:tRNA pseudouridine(13) synthase TruD [Steroidobacteraceae bacterium]